MKTLVLILAFATLTIGATRTEVTKIVRPDTSLVIKTADTTKMVSLDTLKITKQVKDTTLILKSDTVIIKATKKQPIIKK